jgi:threonine dehydratase
LISFEDIEEARARIRDLVFYSPCAMAETLSQQLDCEVFLKLENLQRTGSFKDRGSLNKMLQLDAAQKSSGVITASAGNHAQGVAFAARLCGIHATVVMPETTPLSKVNGTMEFGADVLLHGHSFDAAFDRAREIERERGLAFVHPFDDPQVMAGQGTIGLELLEQVPDLDMVLVPVGGGGLISGVACAIKSKRPEVRILGVEAERIPAMRGSVSAGCVEPAASASTLADGIAVARVGAHTFPIVRDLVDDIVTVPEDDIANAVMELLEREKTLSEGAGAVTFAALKSGRVPGTRGRKVVAIVSGGNIDMMTLSILLERGMKLDGRLLRLDVVVPDRPEGIADLAAVIANQRSKIIRISQVLGAAGVDLEEAVVELLVETRGSGHAAEIVAGIATAGMKLK